MANGTGLRAQARKCRTLARDADRQTAANLRMLADEYDEEARQIELRPNPPQASA